MKLQKRFLSGHSDYVLQPHIHSCLIQFEILLKSMLLALTNKVYPFYLGLELSFFFFPSQLLKKLGPHKKKKKHQKNSNLLEDVENSGLLISIARQNILVQLNGHLIMADTYQMHKSFFQQRCTEEKGQICSEAKRNLNLRSVKSFVVHWAKGSSSKRQNELCGNYWMISSGLFVLLHVTAEANGILTVKFY